MRRAFTSLLDASGLLGSAAPVAGSTRRTAPLRTAGSPGLRRRLWLRSAPPSAVGAVSAVPTAPGGSPQGLAGVGVPERVPPNWPQSAAVKLAHSPPET